MTTSYRQAKQGSLLITYKLSKQSKN